MKSVPAHIHLKPDAIPSSQHPTIPVACHRKQEVKAGLRC